MGHQLSFHATPADIAQLEAALRALEPIAILHDRSPTAAPRVVPSLAVEESGHRWLYYKLVRASDLDDVITDHVPAQGYWTVDVLRSPVVEVNSCYFDGKLLRLGRLYYVDGFYGPGNAWVEKPPEFQRWAQSVLKATRKLLKKRGADYIGPDAAAWVEREGGTLKT